MGILKQGPFGKVTGKVGGTVGSTIFGKNTIRSYAVPSNPNTAGQIEQRSKFRSAVAFAKTILSSVINTYWKDQRRGMSPYNAFMSINIGLINGVHKVNITNQITQGSLEVGPVSTASYSASFVEISYSTSTQGNGLPTDKVLAVIYDTENNISFVNDAEETRSNGEVSVNVGLGRTAANLICFIGFYRQDGKKLLISNSTAAVAT